MYIHMCIRLKNEEVVMEFRRRKAVSTKIGVCVCGIILRCEMHIHLSRWIHLSNAQHFGDSP